MQALSWTGGCCSEWLLFQLMLHLENKMYSNQNLLVFLHLSDKTRSKDSEAPNISGFVLQPASEDTMCRGFKTYIYTHQYTQPASECAQVTHKLVRLVTSMVLPKKWTFTTCLWSTATWACAQVLLAFHKGSRLQHSASHG